MWCGASCKIRRRPNPIEKSGWGSWPGADAAGLPITHWGSTPNHTIGGSDALIINIHDPICVLAEDAGTYGHYAGLDLQTSSDATIRVGIIILSDVPDEVTRFEIDS